MIATPFVALAITPQQLRRLQVLYAQYAARSLDADTSREARIAFASQRIRRTITSFSELTLDEGKTLIDGLQAALGVKMPSKTPRRRMGRRDAEKAATEGRRDQIHAEATLASAADLARIRRDLDQLSWNEARFNGFMESRRWPLKLNRQIRTLGDANKVHWALVRFIRAAGKPASPKKETPHDPTP